MSSYRVLIVDDHEDNITHVSDFLTFKGCDVSVAQDGEKGVEMALEEDPDVILMDIQMPELSGVDAIRILREKEQTKNAKIIAVTARATEKDRKLCMDAGADAYLSKPFKLKVLFEKMIEIINS